MTEICQYLFCRFVSDFRFSEFEPFMTGWETDVRLGILLPFDSLGLVWYRHNVKWLRVGGSCICHISKGNVVEDMT
jgi:hypothetical protein